MSDEEVTINIDGDMAEAINKMGKEELQQKFILAALDSKLKSHEIEKLKAKLYAARAIIAMEEGL